ncbi:carbonyl reductase [NADPH] 3-like [Lepus europaeus]|uniref:carbonyl reductase [NADPH] 3-like n=1 Tax=Lepus europaeus TaxID=9983 RepID=UPI002B494022|nr:carbonyl reductase [NADPH] 3-like [Lepus europaeus]
MAITGNQARPESRAGTCLGTPHTSPGGSERTACQCARSTLQTRIDCSTRTLHAGVLSSQKALSSCVHVALVTGANKGVGFAITRDLCRLFSGDMVLTARDEARGWTAVQQLQAEGLSPRFHQLDITDLQSIRALRDFLRREYGGLDVLVNNAAIYMDCKEAGRGTSPEPLEWWEF